MLHGYSIAVRLEFEADELDHRNWVIDFGSLKPVKAFLVNTFDHKMLVAEDDPCKDELCYLGGMQLADVVVLPAVGCEAFAKYIHSHVAKWLAEGMHGERVWLASVEVKEHGANSAIYFGKDNRILIASRNERKKIEDGDVPF